MHIIGTAGHVDHGKSALVIALTGHNPDRLLEEQRRGMTLDLGFAPLRFSNGIAAGIVDVPGHERFLHNMLAGAAGMELLLLVVAATEGPRAQTLEHLQILNFLNVARAIVVLTKSDLAGAGQIQTSTERTRAMCRGTIAQNAPIVEVSSLTGAGIERLRSTIHDALAGLPPRPVDAPAFLPIDRVFALPGHGTIVTGTLMQGTVTTGDTLRLQPTGLPARIKSLQIFGERVGSATGGSRLAANIAGIAVEQVRRGHALAAAREFAPAREIWVDFVPAPNAVSRLRKRMPVRVHVGSAEIAGQLRFPDGPPRGAVAARATIVLSIPTVHYPGMRLILRRMSPKDLLGGAVTVSESASRAVPGDEVARRAASSGVRGASANQARFADAPAGAGEIARVLENVGLLALDEAKLSARINALVAATRVALQWLVENGTLVRLHKPVEYLASAAGDEAYERVRSMLQEHHERFPWRLGLRSKDIAAYLNISEPLCSRLLEAWAADGRLAARLQVWHLPGFSPSLSKPQQVFFEKTLAVGRSAPYLPFAYEDVRTQAARHSPSTAEALDSLLAVGALVRVGDDLYRQSQIEGAQSAIRKMLDERQRATMAQLRDVLGTSRRHALPLMEHFDSMGFTIRDGDLRRLRQR